MFTFAGLKKLGEANEKKIQFFLCS